MRYVNRWVPIVLLVAAIVGPSSVDAQRSRDGAPSREQVEQRVRAQMGRMMQERLGLDEEHAAQLSEVVQAFDRERRELGRREQETRRRVEALSDATGADEREALALLHLQAELRLEEAQLFRAEQDALLEVLTARQVLELQDLREDLGRRIRALRGGGRAGDARGPGPRPDGRIGDRPRIGSRPPVL